MKFIPIRITLLSPFFNYAEVTNQGAITSNFIGDIALTYAFNRVLRLENFYTEYRNKPNYTELRSLNFYVTVGMPVSVERTPIYIRNTLFNVDGYPQMDVLHRDGRFSTGKTLFKNFFQVQGIKPESEFQAVVLAKDTIELPTCIRLGTGKECLARIEKIESVSQIWLNLFTLKNIFEIDNIENYLLKLPNFRVEYKLENYILMQNLQKEHVEEILGDVL